MSPTSNRAQVLSKGSGKRRPVYKADLRNWTLGADLTPPVNFSNAKDMDSNDKAYLLWKFHKLLHLKPNGFLSPVLNNFQLDFQLSDHYASLCQIILHPSSLKWLLQNKFPPRTL
jgi:hypothetical protein